MRLWHKINDYFKDTFSPLVRYLHYIIIILVIAQIILSNFMNVEHNQKIGSGIINYFAVWSHIILGISTFIVSLIFIAVELKKHGVRYFYPYIYRDYDVIKLDISTILHFKEPVIHPRGLISSIEGLGLGALLLTTLSGIIWFLLWINHYPFASYMQEFHQSVTTLLEIYIIGHGSMGLLHIFKNS